MFGVVLCTERAVGSVGLVNWYTKPAVFSLSVFQSRPLPLSGVQVKGTAEGLPFNRELNGTNIGTWSKL